MTTAKIRVYNSSRPVLQAGHLLQVKVGQDLKDLAAPGGEAGRMTLTGERVVELQVQEFAAKLTPDLIAGMFPPPDSDDTPDEFLPHLALTRRTLPWERSAPSEPPWLWLMVVSEQEIAEAPSDQVRVKTDLLKDIAPKLYELNLLCHVKRSQIESIPNAIPAAPEEEPEIPPDPPVGRVDTAIVLANRLPDAAAGRHYACLVDVKGRFDQQGTLKTATLRYTTLTVLHHWAFFPSGDQDFEGVCKLIRCQGGVLRYGNLPQWPLRDQPTPLTPEFPALVDHDGFLDQIGHDQPGAISWRGPLRPFPPGPRSKGFAVRAAPEEFADAPPGTPLDYSYATAFEVGRLLAMADQGLLQEMRELVPHLKGLDNEELVNQLPYLLQKKDWVTNPDPYSIIQGQTQSSVLKDTQALQGQLAADPLGLAALDLALGATWRADVSVRLNALADVSEEPPVSIDLNQFTGISMKRFHKLVELTRVREAG